MQRFYEEDITFSKGDRAQALFLVSLTFFVGGKSIQLNTGATLNRKKKAGIKI